jgi:hypothetical protein
MSLKAQERWSAKGAPGIHRPTFSTPPLVRSVALRKEETPRLGVLRCRGAKGLGCGWFHRDLKSFGVDEENFDSSDRRPRFHWRSQFRQWNHSNFHSRFACHRLQKFSQSD